ncbi:hypothetical protein AEMCBJ_12960 [Cupriavidus necator]|uniref:AAA family ATPase n=1 Tax=Cupriavidus necator TaxID=106590 RepID=UPI003F734827
MVILQQGASAPHVKPPIIENIPQALKDKPQWIVWKAGAVNAEGKFGKIPVDPATGKPCSAHERGNWLPFDDAVRAQRQKGYAGIGFDLDGQPFTHCDDGVPLYLIGLDIDQCEAEMDSLYRVWLRLGKPYLEVSPSGKGVRMFALSRIAFRGRNVGGREIYSSGRFLTVTGHSARGGIKDATEALGSVYEEWFGSVPTPQVPMSGQSIDGTTRSLMGSIPPPAETPDQIARVRAMLSYISADCERDRWRNVIWALESTGWRCAEELGRTWSQTAPHRFDESALQAVRKSFNCAGGITLGTLVHHAREGGYVDPIGFGELASMGVVDGIESKRFELLSSDRLRALPPMEWLIKGVLPRRGLGAIYGPSGSGKTFMALDMAAAVAAGNDWFGYKTRQVPVCYVALEGEAGIRARVMAWETHNGTGTGVRTVLQPFSLLRLDDIDGLGRAWLDVQGQGGLVIIDTLNRAAPGIDENASADMGRIIEGAKRLQSLIDGLVVLVHHTGKDVSRGLRGHSSLFAALDGAIGVERSADRRLWSVDKSKDGQDSGRHPFRLQVVDLGTDADGERVTSCVVERDTSAMFIKQSPPLQGSNQKLAHEALTDALAATTQTGMGLCPAGTPCLRLTDAISQVASRLVSGDTKHKTTRAKETITSLAGRGLYVVRDDWLWAA